MAGPTAADTKKMAEGGASPQADYAKMYRNANGGDAAIRPMTNTQLKESGAGFWADMARQGGQVLSP